MSTITADPKMKSVLSRATGATEIRDVDGTLMGIYTPKVKTEKQIKKLFDLKKAHKTLAKEKDQGRPLKEILSRLEATEKRR